MITLKYPNVTPQITDWKERLEEVVLGHKLVEDKDLKAPVLEDGNILLEGKEAIDAHLDKIQGELKSWWYCDC